MSVIWTATRDLQVGAAGTPLSTYHLTAHENLALEIASISTALNQVLTMDKTALGTYTPWTDWVPTWGNLSANPTLTFCRYSQIGKTFYVAMQGAANGTMASTTQPTITNLPVAPKYRFNNFYNMCFYSAAVKPLHIVIPAGSTTLSFAQPDVSGWTDNGNGTNPLDNNFGSGLTWGLFDGTNGLVLQFWYEVA